MLENADSWQSKVGKMDIEIGYTEPITFQGAGHITNFVKYLFNLTPKYENDGTKNNLYFAQKSNNMFFDVKANIKQKMESQSKPFYDRQFRSIEAKNLTDKLISKSNENLNKVISDIFYFRIILASGESMDYADYVDLVNELIKQNENPNLKDLIDFQYLVGHLNQGDNHFHRVMILK